MADPPRAIQRAGARRQSKPAGGALKDFIEEASKLYADAYEHDNAHVSNLVNLYALVSRIRLLSSENVLESADNVVRTIFETYLSPNKSFRELKEILDHAAKDPLRDFADACRAELAGPDPA